MRYEIAFSIPGDTRQHTEYMDGPTPRNAYDMIDFAKRELPDAIRQWAASKQVDESTVTVDFCFPFSESVKEFVGNGVYPDGSPYGDRIYGIDEIDAEFRMRWSMAGNDEQEVSLKTRGGKTALEHFFSYATNCIVHDIEPSRRDPLVALEALTKAAITGEGLDEALEAARATLEEHGYEVPAAATAPAR